MAAKTKTYENAATGVCEDLDPNAAETKRRVDAGEIREVPAGGASGTGR